MYFIRFPTQLRHEPETCCTIDARTWHRLTFIRRFLSPWSRQKCWNETCLRRFISIWTAITYDAPNVWRFYHFDDDGVGLSLLRVYLYKRDAIWIGLRSFPLQTTPFPTEEAFVVCFFFFLQMLLWEVGTILLSYVICPISTNPFQMFCVLLNGAGGCCCSKKCKYSLSASANDSQFMYTKHMSEESKVVCLHVAAQPVSRE